MGSKTVDAHLAGGRALQAAYAARNQNLMDNDAIYRSIMIVKSRENAIGRGSGGSEPAGRVGPVVGVARGAVSDMYRGPRSVRSDGVSLPVSSGPIPSSHSSSSLERQYDALGSTGDIRLDRYGPMGRVALSDFLGREAFDTGYLEAPQ